jgi:hypothetical protein
MRCIAGREVAELLVSHLAPLRDRLRPVVLAVSGYPYTGKTALSMRIAELWPQASVVLPTETTVLSRRERQVSGVDGCAEAGHSLTDLGRILDALCAGEDTAVKEYSWAVGAHASMTTLAGARTGDLVIVDGTVGASREIAARCDLVAFLTPASMEDWLAAATDRDVA